jgi:hypothetical protein
MSVFWQRRRERGGRDFYMGTGKFKTIFRQASEAEQAGRYVKAEELWCEAQTLFQSRKSRNGITRILKIVFTPAKF